MATARLSQVNLVCHDAKASLAFYRRLGLDISDGDIWEHKGAVHHAKADGAGPVDLEFESRRLAHAYNTGFAAERGRVVIWVELQSRDAVDALWAGLLEESVQGLQPPNDAFWGARYAIVEDPDGNPVGLSSPVDPARRSPPPEL